MIVLKELFSMPRVNVLHKISFSRVINLNGLNSSRERVKRVTKKDDTQIKTHSETPRCDEHDYDAMTLTS